MNFATFSLDEKRPIEILTIEHEMFITIEFLFMEHDAHLSTERFEAVLPSLVSVFAFIWISMRKPIRKTPCKIQPKLTKYTN